VEATPECPECGCPGAEANLHGPDYVTITCRRCGLRISAELTEASDDKKRERREAARKYGILRGRWDRGDFRGMEVDVVDTTPSFKFVLGQYRRVVSRATVADLRPDGAAPDPLRRHFWRRRGVVSESVIDASPPTFLVEYADRDVVRQSPLPRLGVPERLAALFLEGVPWRPRKPSLPPSTS
jgi:hypothetical protein